MAKGGNEREAGTVKVEVALSLKAGRYLDRLIEMDGFGESREELVKRFIWHGINQLIQSGRLGEL